jgi:CRP-like cAMP-binding protein
LRHAGLFGAVPPQDLNAVIAASRLRIFRRGQVVFTTGDTLIVVITGRIKVVVRSANGGELTLMIIRPDGVFGELSIAATLEECQLLLIPRETIQDICARAVRCDARKPSAIGVALTAEAKSKDAAHYINMRLANARYSQ